MAQLKSTNVTGNLAVTGSVLASKILKLGGTSDDILMGDGSTTSKQGLIDSLESAMEGNTWRPVKYGTTTVNDTSTTLEFVAGSNIGLTFSGGKLTIANSYSYSLPLAASGTRGGIQIGYTSTENNRAVTLDSEKAYISLPSRLNDYKTSAENAPSTSGWYFFNDTSNESAKTAFGSSAQAATWVSAYSNSWGGQLGISYYSDQIAFRRKQSTTTWASWIPIATQSWVNDQGFLTAHQDLSGYMPKSGGQFTGPVSFKDSTALPSKTLQYVTGIDAFADGGQMGWQSKSDFLSGCVSKVTSTDNALARFNGTGGAIQNSRAILDDTGNLKINNSDGGDIALELARGANADWRFLGTGGNLVLQNNYTTSKGSYYNVLTLNYNSGNATFKGTVITPNLTLTTSGGTARASFTYNSSDDCIELNWRNS